ncbi:MAG: hypothetical protein J0651_00930, partial [Actinobacteria bacterium]|nr:hypothetical protein [Actinomycetota bacterium]
MTQLFKENAFEKLLTCTAEVLAVTPNDSLALTFRGRALASLLRYDEASETLKAALRHSIHPGYKSTIVQL